MIRTLRGAVCALAAVLLLAACSQTRTVPPPCPHVAVVEDTATYTRFKEGPGRDLTDIVLEMKIANFGGFCETDRNRDESGEVEVELTVFFDALRGPASTSRTTSFAYFVAITDEHENILARRVFEGALTFEGNRNRQRLREELTQKIPLEPGQFGDDFTVWFGFQLTDEQLAYNRSTRGR